MKNDYALFENKTKDSHSLLVFPEEIKKSICAGIKGNTEEIESVGRQGLWHKFKPVLRESFCSS